VLEAGGFVVVVVVVVVSVEGAVDVEGVVWLIELDEDDGC
jgi:hypothetical protein